MQTVTVKTKAELESAKSARCGQIIVEGSLADKLKQSKK